ncbi:hypothetical protein V491_00025, partial [Pseudogymnoascus sp. VKM F-3775]
MDNTITSINPFPNDVRTAFQAYIQSQSEDGSQTRNRERITPIKQQRIFTFLNSPHIKAIDAIDARLKHRALTEFHITQDKLYRNSNATHKARYIVQESEVFDLIINEHLQLLHAGRDKVWAIVQQKYYGINKHEVAFILKQ